MKLKLRDGGSRFFAGARSFFKHLTLGLEGGLEVVAKSHVSPTRR